ncbi:protein kinase-like domain, concanavalin A-like lectin/glucanase domain protein [Tanacetum coccineum]
MSRRQYNQIMTYGLRSRQKPSNPDKISNFVGRVKSLKIFIGSFAYECDFMILEDTTSIIDRCLGEMVFGRPFIDKIGLVYDKEEGTISFKQDNEEIKFKMPHTMEIFKKTRFMGVSTDSIPPLAYEENFSSGRTHYYQSLLIGDEYRQEEENRRGIRHLMRLYLMRRSLYSAFGGNTRDLGSFGEETDKTTNLHQHLSRISTQKLETASQITRDSVTTHFKMASQDPQTTSDLIIEQRVKDNQKARILELKQRNYEEYCFDYLYAVSIKKDTTYLCLKLHSASTKEDLFTVSRRSPYAVLDCKSWNILEYNNHGAHAKKPQYVVLNFFNTAYRPNSRAYK